MPIRLSWRRHLFAWRNGVRIVNGDVPFGSDGGLRQKKGADIPQLKNTYSAGLRKVINLCLQAEPWKRPTASELVDYAAHGLKGEYFIVKGEKSLIHRFAPFVLAVCLVIGGFVGYQVYQTKQQKYRRNNCEQSSSV